MLTGCFCRETTMPRECLAIVALLQWHLNHIFHRSRRHHGCSQHYGSIDIRVAQPRYHWHVDSYAPDNVPQSLGPRPAMHDATS